MKQSAVNAPQGVREAQIRARFPAVEEAGPPCRLPRGQCPEAK